MDWRFTIYDRDNIATLIEEPVGWDKNSSEIKRDPDFHGVFFTNQGDAFEFYGPAMQLLKAEHEQYGFEGVMTLVMEENCGNGYEEFSRARFDFNKYEFYCGDSCYVKIPVENIGEVVELRNRVNQKVNLEAIKAFDGVTNLPVYTKLPFSMDLPSKGIFMQNKAVWEAEATTTVSLEDVTAINYSAPFDRVWNYSWFQVVPQIEKVSLSEFGKFATAVTPEHEFICGGFYNDDRCPDLFKVRAGNSTGSRTLFFDWGSCTPLLYNNNNEDNFSTVGSFNLDISYSASFTTTPFVRILFLNKVVLIRRKDGSFEVLRNVQELSATPGGSSPGGFVTGSYWAPETTHTVNETFSVSNISLNEGDYLFMFMSGLCEYINYDAVANLPAYDIVSKGGSVALTSLTGGAPTTSKVFAINETISRIAESITNNKLKGYSEYFGRTDSQPYALPDDGCGSLEVVVDGIRVRRQENKIPGTTNIFSLSLQDVFDGLSPIHNIGMGIEQDTNRPGFRRLRVEPWHYFYNDSIIMNCTNIGLITRKAFSSEAYSTFQFGYAKWEAEEFNGLDEFLTKRVYRTTLSQLNNNLIKLSKFIASGYALEVTRRKGSDNTKDWRYDKEVFIICCKRNMSGAIVVELGNVIDPLNIIDPSTLYNFRIRPIANAMRWMPRVFESYRQFGSDCKLLFTDGDGNYFASGQMAAANCRLENAATTENQTIDLSIYADTDDARPFLIPERVSFDYPMSSRDYKNLVHNPNGQIYFSSDCDEGYGYIDTINYKPDEGTANFNLIPKAI